MKTENAWFVYTSEILGNKECLIASNLPQIEAQELCEEYRRIIERNCPNEFACYGNAADNKESAAKRLGLV